MFISGGRFSKPKLTSVRWSLYKLRITKYHFEYLPREDAYSDSGSDYGNQPSSITEIKISGLIKLGNIRMDIERLVGTSWSPRFPRLRL